MSDTVFADGHELTECALSRGPSSTVKSIPIGKSGDKLSPLINSVEEVELDSLLPSGGASLERDYSTGLILGSLLSVFADDAVARFRRYRHNVSLMILSIDGLNEFRDAYGQAGADEALRHIAAILDLSVRNTDKVARLNADQFAILLHEVDDAGISVLTNRIMNSVNDLHMRYLNQTIPMTVSIGAAIVSDADVDSSTLFRRAEKSLADAKR